MTTNHARHVVRPEVDDDPVPVREDREPQVQERAEPRRRRPELDRLVLGAPLGAAALGLLLAEGARAGLSGESGTTAEPGTTPVGPDAGGVQLAATTPVAGVLGAAPQATGDDAVDTTSAGLQPTSIPGDTSAVGEGSIEVDGGTARSQAAPAEAPAVSDGAATHTGASVSINFSGGQDIAGLGVGDSGIAGDGQERGDIGVVVRAGDNGEVIHGTDAADLLIGGAGDDEIHGHAGDDLIEGRAGDDLLFGGAGDDRLFGGQGRDEIHGGAGDDELDGGAGNDQLFGGGGRDSLIGGAGSDLLDGGAGADTMAGGQGNDQIVLSDLHDVGLENERAADQGGIDTAVVQNGFGDDLEAASGERNATFTLNQNVDQPSIAGTNTFEQQLDPNIENVRLEGTDDHDVVGNGADNLIIGNDGDNVLYGRGGDDHLSGGGGEDELIGGAGADVLEGGAQDDILSGGRGDDTLYGGDGDDLLDGGAGSDRMFGEGGNDTFVLGLHEDAVDSVFDDQGSNAIVIEDGAGHEVETALVDDDLFVVVDKNPIAVVDQYDESNFSSIDSGTGATAIGDLMAATSSSGSSGTAISAADPAPSDLLASYLSGTSHFGSASADHLEGTSAPDWLSGADGDDWLSGSAGHDVLEGGNGSDTLSGGAGDDIYLFNSGESGLDIISDHEGGNIAKLEGFAGARIEGARVGQDLWVMADNTPIFKVEQIDDGGFAGVRNGDQFTSIDDLLA